MREILFRAKDTDGMWQYGDFIFVNDNFCNIKDRSLIRMPHLCQINTLGQYTGLTDKNGKKIFEGDILARYARYERYDKEERIEGVVSYGEWNCSCCDGVYGWALVNDYGYIGDLRNHDESYVIGNIFDNPELLKGDTNDT